jgi:hypothetical protein
LAKEYEELIEKYNMVKKQHEIGINEMSGFMQEIKNLKVQNIGIKSKYKGLGIKLKGLFVKSSLLPDTR